MSGVWKKPARELPPVEIPASTNLQAPEVPQAPQMPVEPPKPEAVGGRRKLAPGSLAQPERSPAADIDARVLRTTRRVLPLQLTVDEDVNYWFRSECIRRMEQKLGHHKLSDLFLLCVAAYKRENGLT